MLSVQYIGCRICRYKVRHNSTERTKNQNKNLADVKSNDNARKQESITKSNHRLNNIIANNFINIIRKFIE